ncbi:acyl-CoA thioesterase [Sediminivirga luteola]|uniref:acyl-CoA thioesterase n=1 Tax=Sediminivirga luteola TaxID=1774748 RepID=UPI001F58075E|nr:thioesterase family protein [Sediminivirga luteola]MCI2264292.1 thioesterase family protein [Sediminivirga luteola]
MTPVPSPFDSVLPPGPRARVLVDLRWGDLDAYGHVNNVAVARLLEEARVRILGSPTAHTDAVDASGRPSADGWDEHADPAWRIFSARAHDTQYLVASHRIEYRRALAYRPGPVGIVLVLSRIGAASIVVGYALGAPGSGEIAVVAETEIVFVDAATGRPRRLEDEERRQLEPLLSGPVQLRRR